MQTEAHYTNGSKGRPAVLAIARTVNGRREWLTRVPVTGKAEARRAAVLAGATPWNF
jgi:hypothetical protein